MQGVGMSNLARYEHELMEYASSQLNNIPGVRIIGNAPCKVGVISFVVENIHALDLGMLLDAQGIAVRTGHHCTQPLMKCFNIEGTVRISFAAYNTKEEIDSFIIALKKSLQRLK